MANEKKTAARLGQFARAEAEGAAKIASRNRVADTVRRRKSLETSLKELEEREKERSRHALRPNLRRRLEQAGLAMDERRFVVLSTGAGSVAFVLTFLLSESLLVSLGAALAGGIGLPRLVVDILRKRRQRKFIDEFPNALDLIVRGVKSGLPLNDTLRMIATETTEPVRSEFRKVVEAIQLGIPVSEGVERLYQSMPLSETNFFAIVISVQSQAGGNLSEALSNLSRVLRDRKKMRAKIQAMSMEAKSSASIIGCLPIVVGGLIYLMTPQYISLLFTSSTGHLILGGGALWMSIGILVMRQMINFDF
ncbi:pilus assembly protein [Aureimonas endophytica]|uniref:Pilus assembly protein n=2 Tax=Aureimonas endophytica TaxID=2027858 RepID=A0A916ZQP9_9HYPH|nr:pilus assembly protein [Aureimonas endophytica]